MNIVALDKNLHQEWQVKTNDLSNTSGMHLCPALAQEYPLLAAEFPIVFIKDAKSDDKLRSVAMLGLKPKQNLFYRNGTWCARYVPSMLRAYPFIVAPIPNKEGQGAVCIDIDSELVLKSRQGEGHALFEASGEESEYLISINRFLSSLMMQSIFTENLVDALNEKALLEEQAMNIKLRDGTSHRLTNIYRVNENKLNELSDEDFNQLRKSGYIPAIYAHLLSLGQANNLARLHHSSSLDSN